MVIKDFRDLLALLVAAIVFPGIWIMQGLGWLNLPESVIGATIVIETLIAQFYWRKANTAETPPQ